MSDCLIVLGSILDLNWHAFDFFFLTGSEPRNPGCCNARRIEKLASEFLPPFLPSLPVAMMR